MIMTSTATVRVIKGALQETELAALVVALDVLSRPSAASRRLPSTPRKATWTRPRRRSGPEWVRTLG